jgi:predicted chitinase
MGVLGQGVRAIIGLKSGGNLKSAPDQQTPFSAAYMLISFMIGFIAGVLAGLVVGLYNFLHIDLDNMKTLLGVAAAGYAGADFVENAASIVIKAQPPVVVATGGTAISSLPLSSQMLVSQVLAPRIVVPADGSTSLTAALSIVAPHVQTDRWVPTLTAAFSRFDLNNNKRIAVAAGQFLVEAGSAFQEVIENTNYTTPERIHAVFPNEFPTVESAQAFVGKPEALANRAYANKGGNGDEASGDGYKFRGRGLIQLTGRDEYAEFGATIGKSAEDAAAYCQTTEGAAMSGCWYLSSRGCLPLSDAWEISAVTRKVNGAAMLGNAQRIAFAEQMLKHLGG